MPESSYNNRESVREWPIEPTFLSISERGIKDRNFLSPNIDGLFTANELRGILADASAETSDEKNEFGTRKIFALFQVVPDG